MSPLANFMFQTGKDVIQQQLEEANEGIDHRMTSEDVDDYARVLDRAQRKLGVREIVLQPGEF